MNKVVELQHVIDRVTNLCLNRKKFNKHQEKGTLDQYYSEIIVNAVTDMVKLPVQRNIEGLDPLDDPYEVRFTLTQLADILCITFGKPTRQVQADIMRFLEEFPAHDIRVSTFLHYKNMLH